MFFVVKETAIMFFGQVERELLWVEVHSHWQNTKLPDNLQLKIDQGQGQQDIWECSCEDIQEALTKQKPFSMKKFYSQG
ncbi:hypothetical protein H6G14_13540 [Nostoc parmelioides FACHB-3921]|uniref:Uncharacterized protein n=2 Tax=Nostoc TaxID=1177 RepID=A0ABR8BEL0_9NOSO|nr:hypothetical protein [Nostoc parmelioides FACHB-3921]